MKKNCSITSFSGRLWWQGKYYDGIDFTPVNMDGDKLNFKNEVFIK